MKILGKHRKTDNRIGLFSVLFLMLLLNSPLRVSAAADFSDYESVRHPLIQTTNVLEEYEALFRLGFLYTGEWESDSLLEEPEESVSEAAQLLARLVRESAYEKARASVVQIRIGGYYGSGVLWDIWEDSLIVASNAHLLQEGQEGQLVFRTGVSVEGTVIGISDTTDIGFMEVPLASLEREDWLFMRFAEQNGNISEKLEVNDGIFVIGSASGAGEDYYEGTIGSVAYYFPEFQSDMLYGYCKAVPGMSGGGTFDIQGNFIGMLTAGTEEGEIASLPVEVMMAEWEEIAVSFCQ